MFDLPQIDIVGQEVNQTGKKFRLKRKSESEFFPSQNYNFLITKSLTLRNENFFNNSKTEANGSPSILSKNYNPASKAKPVGRSNIWKAKREEERQRIERANQKRITEWVKQGSKTRDDLKEEKSQLAAMKLKREAAKRKPPSPAYLINMDPQSKKNPILS